MRMYFCKTLVSSGCFWRGQDSTDKSMRRGDRFLLLIPGEGPGLFVFFNGMISAWYSYWFLCKEASRYGMKSHSWGIDNISSAQNILEFFKHGLGSNLQKIETKANVWAVFTPVAWYLRLGQSIKKICCWIWWPWNDTPLSLHSLHQNWSIIFMTQLKFSKAVKSS